ncbi:MAG: dihydrodipicolinate synthase family protein [Isosphaeraceae bacterium]
MSARLHGLIAATHTPFDEAGRVNLAAVEPLAAHLLRTGVESVFIGGTTGECHSLTVEERLALIDRWCDVARGSKLGVVVHVGSNCLADARSLAARAEAKGARGVSAFAPSYFKPATPELLADCCKEIAAAAPSLPFYFYDIPSMTGVSFPTAPFMEIAATRVPNLGGLKFTNSDLVGFQQCLRACGGRLDVAWGCDEYMLSALALGGVAFVGSTYNFMAPVYHRLMKAFDAGDLETARREQYRAVEAVDLLNRFGYMAASKALMGFLGIDLGAPRLPLGRLSPEARWNSKPASNGSISGAGSWPEADAAPRVAGVAVLVGWVLTQPWSARPNSARSRPSLQDYGSATGLNAAFFLALHDPGVPVSLRPRRGDRPDGLPAAAAPHDSTTHFGFEPPLARVFFRGRVGGFTTDSRSSARRRAASPGWRESSVISAKLSCGSGNGSLPSACSAVEVRWYSRALSCTFTPQRLSSSSSR